MTTQFNKHLSTAYETVFGTACPRILVETSGWRIPLDPRMTVVGEYYSPDNVLRSICHGIKEGDPDAISEAAVLMSDLVSPGDTLVPVPSRHGYATTTLELARRISGIAGCAVADILGGADRRSLYELKKELPPGQFPSGDILGMRLKGDPPENPVIVDNVIATGTTAKAALDTLPGSRLIALAYASSYHPDWNIPKNFRA